MILDFVRAWLSIHRMAVGIKALLLVAYFKKHRSGECPNLWKPDGRSGKARSVIRRPFRKDRSHGQWWLVNACPRRMGNDKDFSLGHVDVNKERRKEEGWTY